MTILVAIIRAIGIPTCLVIGLLAFYEGLPGARHIPYLSSIPIIGDIATGRVHAYAAQQVKLATADLVSKAEVTALQAQIARERTLRLIAGQAATEARNRAAAALRAKTAAQKSLEERIAADTSEDGCVWGEGDLQWLGR